MKKFYYYKGDHVDGFKELAILEAETLTEADKKFTNALNIDPKKQGVVVTLKPKEQT